LKNRIQNEEKDNSKLTTIIKLLNGTATPLAKKILLELEITPISIFYYQKI